MIDPELNPEQAPSTPENQLPVTEIPALAPPTNSVNPDGLHNLLTGTQNPAELDEEDPLAQLRNDPNYAELIRELEYIATQARLLFTPGEEAPSDAVWDKIQQQLPPKADN